MRQVLERFYFVLGTDYTLLPPGTVEAQDDWN